MIDEKDIEIAKLRGQVDALEKLLRTTIALQGARAPVVVIPHIIPSPQPWPFDPGPTYGGFVPSGPTVLHTNLNPACAGGIPQGVVWGSGTWGGAAS